MPDVSVQVEQAAPTGQKTAYTPQSNAGRPTLYTPDMCDQALEYMRQGYSITATAGFLGVCRDTIYEWENTHPEFSYVLKKARAVRLAFHETRLMTEKSSSGVIAAIFALKNSDPTEWRDRHEVAHTGTISLESLVGQSMQAIENKGNEPLTIDGQATEIVEGNSTPD